MSWFLPHFLAQQPFALNLIAALAALITIITFINSMIRRKRNNLQLVFTHGHTVVASHIIIVSNSGEYLGSVHGTASLPRDLLGSKLQFFKQVGDEGRVYLGELVFECLHKGPLHINVDILGR